MRIHGCLSCRCVLERVEVAGGGAVLMCLTCETHGHAHEVEFGVALISFAHKVQRKRKPRAASRMSKVPTASEPAASLRSLKPRKPVSGRTARRAA